MPPRPSYKDRVYTTELVAFPELVHDEDANSKDTAPLSSRLRSLVDTLGSGLTGITVATR